MLMFMSHGLQLQPMSERLVVTCCKEDGLHRSAAAKILRVGEVSEPKHSIIAERCALSPACRETVSLLLETGI